MKAQTERDKFNQWWRDSGHLHGWATAWDAWKGRAVLENPDALDCPTCQGMGTIQPCIDPQLDKVCPDCRGAGEVQ